jgi:malonyl-CoA/methylmalonyl-CoA synthetase
MPEIPLISRAEANKTRTALIAPEGQFTYGELLSSSATWASRLLDGAGDLAEARIAFLTPPGIHYVAVQWGVWRAGGIAVPLCTQHPMPELEYVIRNSEASIVVVHPEFEDRVRPIAESHGLRLLPTSEPADGITCALPNVEVTRRAMIVYTSGTTSRPKGVVTTHDIITAQIESLIEAWGWTSTDHILHVLPLHHVHGIINVLCCALWSGATCEMLPRFDAANVWDRFLADDGPNLFMAVPTVYSRLISEWESASPARQGSMRRACEGLRLMVSGSAALPVPMLEKWRTISGHTLLERYGMTEIGMGLSNPLIGERRPGCVGTPLPGVEIRLRDDNGRSVSDGEQAEIQVRGPTVFREYWQKPDATAEAFTEDGWFRTGDIAVVEEGVYRILGRSSVDIIKTGGYKVSALEIEDVLRTHEAVNECAVVGVEDEEWGQRVAAAVVLSEDSELDLDALRTWGKERLATYKVPTRLLLLDELPRNPMGKVTKPDVVKLFEEQKSATDERR